MGSYRPDVLTGETLGLTTSAAALADIKCVAVILQSEPDNTDDILIGDTGAQTIQLTPGQSWAFDIRNTIKVFAKSVTGTPTLNYGVLR